MRRDRALEGFWLDMSRLFLRGGAIDYDRFIDIAESRGLIERVPFDPGVHDGPGSDGLAAGDPWYVRTSPAKAQVGNRQNTLRRLRACAGCSDTEKAHGDADEALIDYIADDEIADAYDRIGKWYA